MQPDSTLIRAQFPALDRPDIFFDNPGGTQIARHSLDRINQYLVGPQCQSRRAIYHQPRIGCGVG